MNSIDGDLWRNKSFKKIWCNVKNLFYAVKTDTQHNIIWWICVTMMYWNEIPNAYIFEKILPFNFLIHSRFCTTNFPRAHWGGMNFRLKLHEFEQILIDIHSAKCQWNWHHQYWNVHHKNDKNWATSWEFGTYHILRVCYQRRIRPSCVSAQFRRSSLFAHMMKTKAPNKHITPLDGCACVFEENKLPMTKSDMISRTG